MLRIRQVTVNHSLASTPRSLLQSPWSQSLSVSPPMAQSNWTSNFPFPGAFFLRWFPSPAISRIHQSFSLRHLPHIPRHRRTKTHSSSRSYVVIAGAFLFSCSLACSGFAVHMQTALHCYSKSSITQRQDAMIRNSSHVSGTSKQN